VVIHDAATAAERSRNPECVALIDALRAESAEGLAAGNIFVENVVWDLVSHSASFVRAARVEDILQDAPQHKRLSIAPTSAASGTGVGAGAGDHRVQLVLLDQAQRCAVSHLEYLPPPDVLQRASDLGGAVPLRVVLFEGSPELALLESEFPALRRAADRVLLRPWWLSIEGLLLRTDFDDAAVAKLIARAFLSTVAGRRVEPAAYLDLVTLVRNELPRRLAELNEKSAHIQQRLGPLEGVLRDAVEQHAIAQDGDEAGVERRGHQQRSLQAARSEVQFLNTQLGQLAAKMQALPEETVEELARVVVLRSLR
jgi:hypothetical protein